ncbi:MAG: mechanosensitive ion channel protein MscS [Deltaproteobacteria bacterium CG_4_10_14_0_2_um_filter_43_8]|nr:MAG: mechanosensitive ion channel protein MscS [Deltaproteobacteria bacterium CG11_big_fil_rev_8_21_14_0_20_42_23]PJA19246.1 MAG: mechanosensitive ion channel protein MscS [Deltaproteobacteria bacterium CG_4_10_14_0_2_um_filter_43_8]PJC64121.1 MAG: mechanosensitive ion channel protein MscS [Deltaproteobacteria bacterium CG_4_9_14_0_2_um_filter_42_21]
MSLVDSINNFNFNSWLGGAIVIALWLVVFFPLKRIVVKKLSKKLADNSLFWNDVIMRALQLPLTLTVFAVAFIFAQTFLPASEKILRAFYVLSTIFFVLAGIFFFNKLFIGLLERSEARHAELRNYSGMARGGIRVVIFLIGLMFALDNIDISITPLIASLGVGSIAVALALQDTLSNFFSGLYVLIDKPIKTGDFIEIENNIRGYVEKVTLRNTHIRLLANNIVIVPNTKIANSILTNFNKPVYEQSVYVSAGVSYASDLEQVEKITLEVAKKTMEEVEGGVKTADPLVRFNEFADSSVNFTVVLRGQDFISQYLLKHEFIKRLHKRYHEEGIEIPFPIRTVIMKKEEASEN